MKTYVTCNHHFAHFRIVSRCRIAVQDPVTGGVGNPTCEFSSHVPEYCGLTGRYWQEITKMTERARPWE